MHVPEAIAPAVSTAATARTMGQIVPGPVQNNTAVMAAIVPAHSHRAAAHRDAGRTRDSTAAVATSIAIMIATALPEFSHQPTAL